MAAHLGAPPTATSWIASTSFPTPRPTTTPPPSSHTLCASATPHFPMCLPFRLIFLLCPVLQKCLLSKWKASLRTLQRTSNRSRITWAALTAPPTSTWAIKIVSMTSCLCSCPRRRSRWRWCRTSCALPAACSRISPPSLEMRRPSPLPMTSFSTCIVSSLFGRLPEWILPATSSYKRSDTSATTRSALAPKVSVVHCCTSLPPGPCISPHLPCL
mmetsp:Transcript_15993/g.26351  ORF Transcript_15993/g.26351 Transcript_15993/m.26351 type:complete len:215 (-) Transcript_15993:365-1009(-)